MGNLIGRRGHKSEAYPSTGGFAGAALIAARNRNVLIVPASLTSPFAPGVSGQIIAAILFTPRVSGVVQVTASLVAVNDVTPDVYAMSAFIIPGTNLTVSGGEPSASSNGWVVGTSPVPSVGGVQGSAQILGASETSFAASGRGSVSVSAAVSQPIPIGVPVVIEVLLGAAVGALASDIAFVSLSVMELP